MAPLIHCSFGILFECYFLSEAWSRERMFPSVLTVLFSHHWCFLAWLFCYIIAQTICAWHPSFSALIVSVLEWLCYLRIHSPNRPCILCRFLPIPTPHRILWMNETSEALLILLIVRLVWSRELPDSKISSLYQRLSIISEHSTNSISRTRISVSTVLMSSFWLPFLAESKTRIAYLLRLLASQDA